MATGAKSSPLYPSTTATAFIRSLVSMTQAILRAGADHARCVRADRPGAYVSPFEKIGIARFAVLWCALLIRKLITTVDDQNGDVAMGLPLERVAVHGLIGMLIATIAVHYNHALALSIIGFFLFGAVTVRSSIRSGTTYSWQLVAMTERERVTLIYGAVFFCTWIAVRLFEIA